MSGYSLTFAVIASLAEACSTFLERITSVARV